MTHKQTHRRTWRLYVRPGPEGRVGENDPFLEGLSINLSKDGPFPKLNFSAALKPHSKLEVDGGPDPGGELGTYPMGGTLPDSQK